MAASRPPGYTLDGVSITPVLLNGSNTGGAKTLGRDALYWEHEGNRAVRVGDWKLVASFRGPWEFYDLTADRTETADLAAQRPERVADHLEDVAHDDEVEAPHLVRVEVVDVEVAVLGT